MEGQMGFRRWYNAQKVGVQVAVVGGVLAIVSGVVAGVFGIVDVELAKPSAQTSTSALAPARTTSAAAAVTPSSGSAASSTLPATAAATGAITDPSNGATNVYKHEQLHVSGTAQNIPAGYRLDVFLQFSGDQRYYAAADPNIAAPLINGHWSSTIFIGDAKPIILWLVSLSPAQVNFVNDQVADQTAGYPTLPGTRLASVSFTAKASP
jgi:hypothetical protein